MAFKFRHFRLRIWLLAIFVLGTTATSHVFAGQTVVSKNGQPLDEATVTFLTPAGEQLATAKTDRNGTAKTDLPLAKEGGPNIIKVVDKEGNATYRIIVQPPGMPWHLVALDTAGGINGYSEKTFGFLKDAARPITVGANAEVGSGARLKQKVTEAVGKLLGGAIGGFFGGGGGGGGGGGFPFGGGGSKPSSGSGDDIKTVDDPIAKEKKRIFTDPASGTKIAVGTRMTPDGLLVSTTILESPGDGTFQTIYLMDPEGRKAGPIRYDAYEMYVDWKLTVAWTEDHYINGKHVSHKEGGWSKEGHNILGTFTVPRKGEGIWSKLGFSNAVQGVKSLGTLFPISPSLLAAKPMSLVVHVTKPGEDPVITTPFVVGISEDCPCHTAQTASVVRRLNSAPDAEIRELRERLESIDERIERLSRKIDFPHERDRAQRDLDRERNLRDRPDINKEQVALHAHRVRRLKQSLEELETQQNEFKSERFELRQQRAEIEDQLNRLTDETAGSSGPSILSQLESARRRNPCPCVTRERTGITSQLPSEKEAEALETRRRELEEELRTVEEEIRRSLRNKEDFQISLAFGREDLEFAKSNYFADESDAFFKIKQDEQRIETENNKLDEMSRRRNEIRSQLDHTLTPQTDRSSSNMERLESETRSIPCICGRPQIHAVNVPLGPTRVR